MTVVADTGALVALVDADDRHHPALREAFATDPGAWVVPWAVLPEVDHILASSIGATAARTFRRDVADGLFRVDWDGPADLARALELEERYADLALGLVDAVVMAMAERVSARAIATLDLRDFGAVELQGAPQLWPRDL